MKRNLLGHAFRSPRLPGAWRTVILCAVLLAAFCVTANAETTLFTDSFDASISNWTNITNSTVSWDGTVNIVPATGSGSAKFTMSVDKIYHDTQNGLPFSIPAAAGFKATWYIYDNTATRPYGELDSRVGGTYGGGLSQLFAIGKYNNISMPGEVYDGTKYQGRVLYPSATGGWFNLNLPGAPARSTGWHKFAIERTFSGDLNFYVDDILSRTFSGATAFDMNVVTLGFGTASAVNGTAWFDGVTIVKYGTAPGKATSPSPANGAIDQPANAPGPTLSWSAGSPAGVSYDVYLGTNSAALPKVSPAQPGTSYSTGALTASKQYYWRVDTLDADGHPMKGDVWNFWTTGPGGILTPTAASGGVATPGAASAISPLGKYTNGTVVPLTTTAAWGYMFKKWSSMIDGSDTVSWASSFNYAMPNDLDHPVYAIFVPVHDIIIESRSDGKHFDWYSDSGNSHWGDSTAKSTAPGVTAAASRYSSIDSLFGEARYAAYAPVLSEAGRYVVYVSWGSSTNGGKHITHEVDYAGGGKFTMLFNQNQDNVAGEDPLGGKMNVWQKIGTFDFDAGSTGQVKQYSVVMETGLRVLADSANFRFCPPKATTPIPADGAFKIALPGQSLSWTSGGNALAYDVYFGTVATPPKVTATPLFDATTYALPTLAYNTRYYWRINPINNTTTVGDVWTFITQYDEANSKNWLALTSNPLPAATCTGAGYHAPSEVVAINATPTNANYYEFVKWTTDQAGTTLATTSPAQPVASCNYTMPLTGDSVLYAQFKAKSWNVSLVANPTAGGAPTVDGGAAHDYGTPVTVHANTPNAGYFFLNWSANADGTGIVSRKPDYTFNMPGGNLTLYANYVKAIFAEGFEGLATGSLDMNDPMGPNQAANGDLTSGQPWWGTNPANGSVGVVSGLTAHSGPNALWDGGSGNGRDYINLAYRCNGGSAYVENIYADWWFYDRCGTVLYPPTTGDYCDDPFSLVYNQEIPANLDWPTGYGSGSGQSFTDAQFDQKISLGMCDLWTPDDAVPAYTPYADFHPGEYQARIKSGSVPNQTSFGNGWYNVDLARSVGWHHGRITVGVTDMMSQTEINFYIDDMSTSLLTGVADAVGFNAIELNTQWKNGPSTDTTNIKWPKGTMYDDIVIGPMPQTTPAAPVAAAASGITASGITWYWTQTGTVDGFHVYDAATLGNVKGTTTATNYPETLVSNTLYSRWVASHNGEVFESTRTPLAATYTWAALPSATNVTAPAAGTYGANWAGVTNPQGFGTGGKVSSFKYKWSTNASDTITDAATDVWNSGILTTKPATAGTWYLYLRSYNGAAPAVGNGSVKYGPYVFNFTAPTGSIVIDGGETTTSTSVTLTLTSSGATTMSFSNTNNGSDWSTAEAAGPTKSWTLTSGAGLKTVYVKFADALGNTAVFSDTITYSDATAVAKISDLWGLPDGSYKLSGKTVTGAVGGAFWIEETDRSAAIKVIGSATQDRKVDVTGALSTIAGQRVLTAILVEDKGAGDTINPLGVIEKSTGGKGGSGNPSITDGVGLYNIGLLVRIAGKVTSSGADFFYLDDGSGLVDGANSGIKVLCGSIAPATSGDKTVTGLVGVVGGKPVLIIRGAGDIL